MTYDPLNIKITDLNFGFIVDYNGKSWLVKEAHEYDFKRQFSKRFLLSCGNESIMVYLESDSRVFTGKEINPKVLQTDLADVIAKTEKGPEKFQYNEMTFFAETNNSGYVRDMSSRNKMDWNLMNYWLYQSEDMKAYIRLEQRGNLPLRAFYAELSDALEFDNILPKGQD